MQVDCLTVELDTVKFDLYDLEQYGRRSSIRLNNYKPSVNPNDEEQLTESVTHFWTNPFSRPLGLFEFETLHGVVLWDSRKGVDQSNFAHYQVKRRVFAAKSSLKGNLSKIFITEDLTSHNHSMVKQLLSLKKGKKIDSFWTSDGRMLVKKEAVSDPIYVSPRDSISGKKMGFGNRRRWASLSRLIVDKL